jgi:protein SCO1
MKRLLVPGLALAACVLAGCVAAAAPFPAATPGTSPVAGAPTSPGAPAATPAPAAPASAAAAAAATDAPAASLDPATTLARYAVPGEPPAGALDLTADDGGQFDLAALRGRPVLVYFGYTSCPDVCPATTGVLAEVIRGSADPPRVVFVTVDPERDTADVLHRYLSYLPAGFVGLTGSAAAVRTAADAFGVDYARVDTGSASGYTMAHTADVTLIDAAGRVRARFPFGTDAAEIAAALAALAG